MKTNSGVAYGEWLAPSIGSAFLDPVKLDIDHLAPLENAHRSGGYAWDSDRKRAYANDLNKPAHLVAVTRRREPVERGQKAGRLAAAG